MSDTQTLIENRPPSVAHLLLERVAKSPEAEAYRYPVPAAAGEGPDEWKALSWAQAAERVDAVAAGLIDLGLRPEDRVALASATRIEWILAALGIMCAGAATTTIYPQTNAEESAFILADSGSRVLIADNAALCSVVDRVAVMRDGRVVEQGPLERLARPGTALSDLGIGMQMAAS